MDDFDRFDSKRFVSKMLGMGDIEGLMEKVGSIEINQKDVTEKLVSGNFKLVDFKNIYSQIMGLGPLSKMLEMIPGMQNIPITDETKFRKIVYIFDSFNKQELHSNGDIFNKEPSRVQRVARGSGTTAESVAELLLNFRQMNGMMKKMMANPMFSQMLSGEMSAADKSTIKKKAKGHIPDQLLDYMDTLN